VLVEATCCFDVLDRWDEAEAPSEVGSGEVDLGEICGELESLRIVEAASLPAEGGALSGEARSDGPTVVWAEAREPPALSSSAEFPPLPSRSLVGTGELEWVDPAVDLVAPRVVARSFLVGRVVVALSPSGSVAAVARRRWRRPLGWVGS
jgi:hypothetical protein